MKKINKNCLSCKSTSECLELIANQYSLIYTFSILTSIIISIILLGWQFDSIFIRIFLGVLGLVLAIIPLVFKDMIEKIHGYHELAMDFKNLEQDFKNEGDNKKNWERLKSLTRKLADYHIDGYTKWRVKRRGSN